MPLKTVAIIPARSGSKGIPNKNTINFCGKPLIAWSILQARSANSVDEVYVTSDGEDILDIANSLGAKGIKRPIELSGDLATSESALLHAIDYIEKTENTSLDKIVFLQATSPIREKSDIEGAIQTFVKSGADSLFSASYANDFTLWKANDSTIEPFSYDPFSSTRRQERKDIFLENGSIYIFKRDMFCSLKTRFGGKRAYYLMEPFKSFELDEPWQIPIMEFVFNEKIKNEHPFYELKNVTHLFYDFDGVMTNNSVFVSQDGNETVGVSRADGWGISQLKKISLNQAILSTEENRVVSVRAEKLKIPVYQGISNKKEFILDFMKLNKLRKDNIAYVGNDMNDYEAMLLAGLRFCPSDAHVEIRKIADFVTSASGGNGCIREIADIFLAQNQLMSLT